jgi:hypothetical protein
MIECMEKVEVRMVLVVEDEIRDALRLESALSGKDMKDIIEELVKEHLRDALAQIRKRRALKEKGRQQQKD